MRGPPREGASTILPGEPASVGRARRWVADALSAWGLDGLVDDARLLVSEVVSNAVLHAGTEIEVRVRPLDAGVRIEVADGSPMGLAPRRYQETAVTGRGLRIVASTASSWGSTPTPTGKVVWFELGGAEAAAATDGAPTAGSGGAGVVVHWQDLPVQLMKATLEHGDAMLRELALLSFDDDEESVSFAPLVTPRLDLAVLIRTINEADEAGLAATHAEMRVPPDALEPTLERLALIDEADHMAIDGKLLIPAALPEIVECRHWLLGQIVAQVSGEPPTRWELRVAAAPDRGWEPLTEEEIGLLGDDVPASIVADQENRVVFIGDEAARLLGWEPAKLVGRRLTALVPHELREAHLVGFTRCQVTGRSSLAGQPLALRALRADGSEVDVEVVLGSLPRLDGRFRHRAVLRPR